MDTEEIEEAIEITELDILKLKNLIEVFKITWKETEEWNQESTTT